MKLAIFLLCLAVSACSPPGSYDIPPPQTDPIGSATCNNGPFVAVMRWPYNNGEWGIYVREVYGKISQIYRRYWASGVDRGQPDPDCWEARPTAWQFPGGGDYWGYHTLSTMSLELGTAPEVWMKLQDTGNGSLAPQEVTGTSCWESDDGGASWSKPDCGWFDFLASVYGQTIVN